MQIKSFTKVVSSKTSNKTSSKILSLLLTIALSLGMLTGLSDKALAADATSNTTNKNSTVTKAAPQDQIYVALGDSIPAGYGLADTNDSYVKLFSDQMNEAGFQNTMYNYAFSGATTDSILLQLDSMQTANPDALQTIKNASVITVNIGGNKVLGPFLKAVNTQLEQQFTTMGITNITEASDQQLWTIAASLYTMKLDATSLASIQQGAQHFIDEFPQVIEWLKANAPSANLIVSTIYNPVPSYLSFYKTSEALLKDMNAAITGGAEQHGYYVADIYSAFSKELAKGTQIINLNLDQDKTIPISIDIHPNKAGHKLISKVHTELFKATPIIIKTNSNSNVTSLLSLSGTIDKNGTFSTKITKQFIQKVIDKAKSEVIRIDKKDSGITILLNNTDNGTKALNITLEASAMTLLKTEGVKELNFNTNIFNFSFDKEAIESISHVTKSSVTVKVTPVTKLSSAAKKLIGTRPVFKISISDEKGKIITNFNKGKLSLSIPYSITAKEKADNLHLIYINSKGQSKLLTGSSYVDGWVSYTTNLLSTFGIGYQK